jgi:hypothetical protein
MVWSLVAYVHKEFHENSVGSDLLGDTRNVSQSFWTICSLHPTAHIVKEPQPSTGKIKQENFNNILSSEVKFCNYTHFSITLIITGSS